jgi:hypothetical protein
MATLSSWKAIMNPPKQVVTDGGYAVNVESDEGKAVLAARAELANVSAALQPSAVGDIPDAATRSDTLVALGSAAQGEGDTAAAPTSPTSQTSQTINHTAIDDAPPLSIVAPETAGTLPLAPTVGAGVKPHIRYGKRVGDFSAASYAATERSSLDAANAEPDPTAIAAPKSIT